MWSMINWCGSDGRPSTRKFLQHLALAFRPVKHATPVPILLLLRIYMNWPRFTLRHPGGVRGFAREASWRVLGLACWVPFVIFVNDNVVIPRWINGPSMYPYFNEDIDRTTRPYVTVDWRWNAQSRLERGMVVTF